MANSKDSCKVVWKRDPRLGWVAVVDGDCSGLAKVIEGLTPARRRYLSRRIVKE